MAAVNITKRQTGKGPRWIVRFRLGGREARLQHAGTFPTEREARARRDFCRMEIAAGRNPMVALAEMMHPYKGRTLDEWFDAFIRSRVDVAAKTADLYKNAQDRLGNLADRDPNSLAPADFQEWIAENAKLSPKTLGHYLSSIRQVIDFAEIEPNPARSSKVKLPSPDLEEISPPSGVEWQQIKANFPRKVSLIARLIECEALRLSEALGLTYGDIDFSTSRIRVSRARTKRRTAGQRWLPVPDALMDELAGLVPPEDRHRDRRVFPGFTGSTVRDGLYRACRDAGVVAYSPHDLRHRRVSLWFAHRLDQITIKTWAGHARASMSSDVYAHIVIDPTDDEWRDFWVSTYRTERLPAPSRSEAEST